jgi:hypothetical protein
MFIDFKDGLCRFIYESDDIVKYRHLGWTDFGTEILDNKLLCVSNEKFYQEIDLKKKNIKISEISNVIDHNNLVKIIKTFYFDPRKTFLPKHNKYIIEYSNRYFEVSEYRLSPLRF